MNNINNLDQFNKHIKRVIISKEEIEAEKAAAKAEKAKKA